MKKKSILSVLIIICIYFAVFTLSSCNKDENPVKPVDPPPVGPDTADRYIWFGYESSSHLLNVYVADTDKIYFIGGTRLYTLQDNQFVYYNLNDPNFTAEYVYGYDRNNLFVMGYYSKSNKNFPEIKKITFGNISSFLIGNICDYLNDILIIGPDQAWISDAYYSRIYYFNNGNIKEYIINQADSLNYQFFYMDKNKDLFVFGAKTHNNINGDYYTYKLINDKFELQRIDCFDDDPCLSPRLFRCGTDILMSTTGLSKLRYFNGIEWVLHSDSAQVTQNVSRMGGISKDSLIMVNNYGKVYTYRGKYWKQEKNIPVILDISPNLYYYNAEMKFGNVYIAYWGYTSSALIIGKSKKILKL